MKLFLYSLLMLGLAVPVMAAEDTAPKKEKDAAKTEAKPKAGKSKSKGPQAPSAADKALAESLSAAQKTKLMGLLNTGDDKELGTLPGVGLVRATAIKTARPLKEPTDLLNVTGIGPATYKNIINYAKADFVAPPPKTKGAAKKKKDAVKGTEAVESAEKKAK
jgi:DNA uptake protein ComE-like DNA-binding protein